MRLPEYRPRYQFIAPNASVASYDASSGVQKFELIAQEVRQTVGPGVTARAWGYNGGTPGPFIVVREHEQVQIVLRNELRENTAIHWPGLNLPNQMDGFPLAGGGPLVQPGEEFTYAFTPRQAGTFLYHADLLRTKQELMGLVGMLVVLPLEREPVDRDYAILLQAWNLNKAGTIPGLTQNQMDWISQQKQTSSLHENNALSDHHNYFTFNGRVYPDTAPLKVKEQERIRIRIGNSSTSTFPMHLQGHTFQVVAMDGNPLRAPIQKSTISVGPGETCDIVFLANNPGTWAFHCRNPKSLMTPQHEVGGMLTTIRYVP